MEDKDIGLRQTLRDLFFENMSKHTIPDHKQKPCSCVSGKNDLQQKDYNANTEKREKEFEIDMLRGRECLMEQQKDYNANKEKREKEFEIDMLRGRECLMEQQKDYNANTEKREKDFEIEMLRRGRGCPMAQQKDYNPNTEKREKDFEIEMLRRGRGCPMEQQKDYNANTEKREKEFEIDMLRGRGCLMEQQKDYNANTEKREKVFEIEMLRRGRGYPMEQQKDYNANTEKREKEFEIEMLRKGRGCPMEQQKDYNANTEKREKDFEIEMLRKGRGCPMELSILSGGDADRNNFDPARASLYSGNSSRYEEQFNSRRHFPSNSNTQAMALPSKTGVECGKRQRFPTQLMPVDEGKGDRRGLYESVSQGDFHIRSDAGSSRSQKSSKTVLSRKSSHELKEIVKAQCKFQDAVNETIKEMCNPEQFEDKTLSDVSNMLYDPIKQPDALDMTHCKHCTDKSHATVSSQRDVSTDMGKSDLAETASGDILTISVDDVVNSKVVNPMMRKFQRMYLNNLKDEMSLMEDFERLPHKVNEVYKATIFKQSSG